MLTAVPSQDDSINLQEVIFHPDNILDLFAKFDVPREFDLLSIDADKVCLKSINSQASTCSSTRVPHCTGQQHQRHLFDIFPSPVHGLNPSFR